MRDYPVTSGHMKEMLFASDLDNTLIYSLRHLPEVADFICVEHLEGKEQAFMTKASAELLGQINQKMRFVPITTRSVAQYRRIEWPEPCLPDFALATNGAILLKQGEIDETWWEESQKHLRPWREELHRMQACLAAMEAFHRSRIVDDSYLFVPCDSSEGIAAVAQHLQGMTALLVQYSGRKIYLLPPGMDKGAALQRLKKRWDVLSAISAGDSMMDLPMLWQADISFVPDKSLMESPKPVSSDSTKEPRWICPHEDVPVFSDFILQSIKERL